MFEKIKNIFKCKEPKKSTPLKTLRDVDFFDTIWLQDKNGAIYEGWVYDKSRKHLIVTVLKETGELIDYRFLKHGSLSATQLEQEHRILYFNDPCLKDK